jgi:hypothetical protein
MATPKQRAQAAALYRVRLGERVRWKTRANTLEGVVVYAGPARRTIERTPPVNWSPGERERAQAASRAARRWRGDVAGVMVRVEGASGAEWWCPSELRLERLNSPAEIRALPRRPRAGTPSPGGGTDRALPGYTTFGAKYEEDGVYWW